MDAAVITSLEEAWEGEPVSHQDGSGNLLVPGRSCDGCTLCCKLMRVSALQKPHLVLCEHCDEGIGCRIYADRPKECRDFYCTYRWSPELGEEWKPTACGMVMSYEGRTKRVNISVDPERGAVWRTEPYYTQIKAMALHMLRKQGHLVVWEGRTAIVILPNREVPIADDTVNYDVCGRVGVAGEEYEVVLKANPPAG